MTEALIKWMACISFAIHVTKGTIITAADLGVEALAFASPITGVIAFATAVKIIKPIHRPGWLGPWFGNPKPTGGKG